jgi:polycomb protein EED
MVAAMNSEHSNSTAQEKITMGSSSGSARVTSKRFDGKTSTSSSGTGTVKSSSTGDNKKSNAGFRMTNRNQQRHRQPLYCVSWSSDIHSDEYGKLVRYLATCGSRQLTIYETEVDNPRGTFEAKQLYKDEEKDEHFYACAYGGRSKYWGSLCIDSDSQSEEESSNQNVNVEENNEDIPDKQSSQSQSSPGPTCTGTSTQAPGRKRPRSDVTETLILESESQAKTSYLGVKEKPYSKRGPQLICVAGACAVIKIVDPVQKRQLCTLQGHGSDIYDLKVSPSNEFLLLSASVDESVRLWNLQSFSCVAIFAGHHGHRESILSISWHPLGSKFASSGMDKSIRLWNIDDSKVSEALQASQTSESAGESRPSFHPVCEQFPYFASTKVHMNYVDCVHFVGDLLLSKSTYNTIVLWMPKIPTGADSKPKSAAYNPPSDVIALRTFELDNCNIWFVRFAADPMGRLLAVGNIKGEIDIWDIDACKKHPTHRLKAVNCSTIRTLSFSPDGKTLISCNDQASVFKWDAY